MGIDSTLIQTEERFVFVWPEGSRELFAPAMTYDVGLGLEKARLTVGLGWREAFMRRRRRIIVFQVGSATWPVVEFVGADDYESTRELLWPVKRPGGNRQYRPFEEVHRDFQSFRTVPFRDRIRAKGAFGGWAVVVNEEDHDAMIRLALVRARHKRRR